MLVITIEKKTQEYGVIYCDKDCAVEDGVDLKKYSLENLTQEEFDAINYPDDSIDKGTHWETPEGEALPLYGHCCSSDYCGDQVSY
jgi:hypothetical protein